MSMNDEQNRQYLIPDRGQGNVTRRDLTTAVEALRKEIYTHLAARDAAASRPAATRNDLTALHQRLVTSVNTIVAPLQKRIEALEAEVANLHEEMAAEVALGRGHGVGRAFRCREIAADAVDTTEIHVVAVDAGDAGASGNEGGGDGSADARGCTGDHAASAGQAHGKTLATASAMSVA